ncbi:MAG TPA: PEP-CTERM sorting domain-containing protein [Gemmatales bacterium]|nr:PEP-CTERM sorting domain-containing protein [Gemmatales bacterium]
MLSYLRFTFSAALVVACMWVCPTTSVHADDLLYGSTGSAGLLYSINPVTQTVTLIGNSGIGKLGGIAFDANGVLYGVSGGSGGPSELFTLNTTNAAATSIGVVNGIQGVDGLRFAANGTLYGAGWNGVGTLITIDPTNATLLTSTVLSGSGNAFAPGIAFNSAGTLFGSRGNSSGHAEDLVTIDPNTGILTAIGGSTNIISDIWFSPTGTLYASSPSGELYTIDPTTGDKTLLFNTGISQFSGLAGFAAVPEPTTWALIGTAVLGASAIGWKKRRAIKQNYNRKK